MKHFMFVSNFLPHIGGVEYYVHDLATTLSRDWKDEVHVICFDSSEVFYEDRVDYFVHRVRRLFIVGGVFSVPHPVSFFKCMIGLLKTTGRPDTIWTHTRFFISSLLGTILAHTLRIKTVHIEHGTTYVAHSNPLISICSRLWDQTLGRLVLSIADTVIVVSPLGLSFVRSLGAQNPQFIAAGVHADLWQTAHKSEPNSKVLAQRLLFVGRLLPGKAVGNLFEAMTLSFADQFELDIVGDGPQRIELEEKARRLGLTQRVQFHGKIARGHLREWYSNAALFVNPSLSEGGPLTVLEALAAGLPVVSTPVGCVADYIAASGGYGLITRGYEPVELAQKIQEALQRFRECDRLLCSENTVKSFSWSAKATEIRKFSGD